MNGARQCHLFPVRTIAITDAHHRRSSTFPPSCSFSSMVMDKGDVHNLILAAISTALLIAVPLAFVVVARFCAALPNQRPSHSARHHALLQYTSSLALDTNSTPVLSAANLSTGHSATILKKTTTHPIIDGLSHKCTITIFLGSGGHTAEMLRLVSVLDVTKYSPRHYVVGWDDSASVEKVHRLEAARGQNDITSILFQAGTRSSKTGMKADDSRGLDGYTVHQIPRSRHVHQSIFTTPFTLVKSLLVAVPLVQRLTCLSKHDIQPTISSVTLGVSSLSSAAGGPRRASVLLMNGPGTCFALALAVIGARVLGVPDEQTPDLVFVESFARVRTLSLAGKLLYPLCDVFLVQWPGLVTQYPRANYIGLLV